MLSKVPSHKHDLFLIPNGTIHGSGKNNLVLEISATPYIFTFKMYDWMRLDLEGKPRPLNINRAFENLYFERQGERVEEELVSHPHLVSEGPDWKIIHLPTHPAHFYDVHRLEFSSKIEVPTDGSAHILMLVEGQTVLLGDREWSAAALQLRRDFHHPCRGKPVLADQRGRDAHPGGEVVYETRMYFNLKTLDNRRSA